MIEVRGCSPLLGVAPEDRSSPGVLDQHVDQRLAFSPELIGKPTFEGLPVEEIVEVPDEDDAGDVSLVEAIDSSRDCFRVCSPVDAQRDVLRAEAVLKLSEAGFRSRALARLQRKSTVRDHKPLE